jgi:hypothetical protein
MKAVFTMVFLVPSANSAVDGYDTPSHMRAWSKDPKRTPSDSRSPVLSNSMLCLWIRHGVVPEKQQLTAVFVHMAITCHRPYLTPATWYSKSAVPNAAY